MKMVTNINPVAPNIGIETSHPKKRMRVDTIEMDIKADSIPTLQYAGRIQKNRVCQPIKIRNNLRRVIDDL
jgi:hypothetical protein